VNGEQHAVGGIVVGGLVNAAEQWVAKVDNPTKIFDWAEFAMCCFLGGLAGGVPDLLEPATHPNHRGFFHSVAAAALVAHLVSGKHTDEYSREAKTLLRALGAGYMIHIAMDFCTPKCVRLI
jgi:inner membrane protein